jgi:AmmeMemoRadiSam system protein B/AmmeMemoRadiSam system protein A
MILDNKIYILFLLALILSCGKPQETKTKATTSIPIVHQAHLTDGWYNQHAGNLTRDLARFFFYAHHDFPLPSLGPVRALIVPHAGHYYSGLCAATAYQSLLASSDIQRVIILAPSHTMFLRGVALPDYTVYKTTLGDCPVDTQACEALKKCKHFSEITQAHAQEHAVEIQLPFVQYIFNKHEQPVSIVPLVVGNIHEDEIEDVVLVLKKIINEHTLVIISSDFTHHGSRFDYEMFNKNIISQVRQLDSYALQAIIQPSYQNFTKILNETGATICGNMPIKILLLLLQSKTWTNVQPYLSCYYTSAHTNNLYTKGPELNTQALFKDIPDSQADNSVSYVGMIFAQRPEQKSVPVVHVSLTGYEKKALLKLARATLENSFKPETDKIPDYLLCPVMCPGLEYPAGAFVTLNTKAGDLRGCIGSIVTKAPLYQTVIQMAKAAAFNDTRFTPVQKEELASLVIDITVLTPPEPVSGYRDILLGRHGIILSKLNDQGQVITAAVFLPQVPGMYHWTLEETLEHLSVKAGLTRDGWKTMCRFEVFEGVELKED